MAGRTWVRGDPAAGAVLVADRGAAGLVEGPAGAGAAALVVVAGLTRGARWRR